MTSRPQKCPDSFFIVVFLFSRHSSSSFFFKRASSSLFFLSFSSLRLNASSNRPSSRIVSSTFFCRNSASPLPNRRTNADDCSLHLRCVSRAPSAKASSSSSLEGRRRERERAYDDFWSSKVSKSFLYLEMMMKSVCVLTLMKEDTVVSLCVLLLPPHHHRIMLLFSPRRPTTLFKSDYDDDDFCG